MSEGTAVKEDENGAPYHYASGLSCPKCGRVNPPTDEFFASYFGSGTAPCCGCGEGFNPWNQALDLMKWLPNDWTAVCLLPGMKTHFEAPLKPNERSAVDLSANGIPPGAEILNVHVTTLGPPEGPPVFPTLMLLGVKTLQLDPIPRSFGLYSADSGKDSAGKAWAMLNVTWVDPGPDETTIIAESSGVAPHPTAAVRVAPSPGPAGALRRPTQNDHRRIKMARLSPKQMLRRRLTPGGASFRRKRYPAHVAFRVRIGTTFAALRRALAVRVTHFSVEAAAVHALLRGLKGTAVRAVATAPSGASATTPSLAHAAWPGRGLAGFHESCNVSTRWH